jgi:hypothetical protein
MVHVADARTYYANATADNVYNFEEGFLLNTDNFAPTASEVAAVEAEVSDTALTKAIESIKKTVRSGRHVRPSEKVKLNTEQALVFR